MKKITYWLLVILLMVLVFHFSAQPSAQQDLRPYINEYQQFIKILQDLPAIEFSYHQHLVNSHQDTVGFIQFIMRKTIHLGIYGILGLFLLLAMEVSDPKRCLSSRSLHSCLPWKNSQPVAANQASPPKKQFQRPRSFTCNIWLRAALIIPIIAILDEYQQSTIPSRTGCWEDVLLDCCGFLLMTVFIYIWRGLRDLFY